MRGRHCPHAKTPLFKNATVSSHRLGAVSHAKFVSCQSLQDRIAEPFRRQKERVDRQTSGLLEEEGDLLIVGTVCLGFGSIFVRFHFSGLFAIYD